MVLHLLGKKSWNVYNGVNVERVRRDEAEARAREEAEEQRMQDEDAARRLAILRGEVPPGLPESAEERTKWPSAAANADGFGPGRSRRAEAGAPAREQRRRRMRGEDDTDRDIRYARENVESTEKSKQVLLTPHGDDAPLVDDGGHLVLIPPPPDQRSISNTGKNSAHGEKAQAKNRGREDGQFSMHFSNAVGNNSSEAKPWYIQASRNFTNEKAESEVILPYLQDKDVWGNEDLLRKERERARISSSDPFAAMQLAQRQLKLSQKDRATWEQQRAAEVGRQKSHKRRRREEEGSSHGEGADSFEEFALDMPAETRRRDDRSDRHHHSRRHHRKRSRSRTAGQGRRPRSNREGSSRDTR
ncbi:MAG: hypothetical protein FE78DRAFT_29656 [Acidomyces sp. 'richmondensis']|nr:MAG: hypothetical protein FE78DRAFT_29656 [Acidomyces sp. 'richmondensis']